ncbi:AbrB family transcriptional regulator [Schinkia azotoformans]|uniref:Membrane protein AbrB duplication n=1 Tax=Schinkia azotoformans LMG 9581 TaxID=1131731 RepID=K6D457_SCHAZ|nr:AbrB family transcriptional regulator [Schinkia azotoformans]EKN67297.1 membrane protein AbrB duplication [Schinkia azotoformans LMG 9581]MEC1639453.1 AbrB family transcriptional regulator [Schinkia azotoformans]MEC1719596.1 AbrB family transcriptional regulator [Schinkia azotoformans]MEC1944293.1 AbrB family transcriptional regulator [Schinkia azotoformans]MED4412737.1 AbrB family transcriptional regulator [Schinkia azotoformans]
MKATTSDLLYQIWFIILCGLGGLLLSLMGLPIGWMIGSLIFACLLSLWPPKKSGVNVKKGLNRFWFLIGQYLLGIELGRNVNTSVMTIFQENWITVILVISTSILFSFGTGLFLYRFSRADKLTGLLATSPGGIATMPTIAEEVGANIGVVTAVQAMRVFLVVTIIPVVLFCIVNGSGTEGLTSNPVVESPIQAAGYPLFVWTIPIMLAAFAGAFIGKRIKLPAPWLIGSLLGVIIFESASTTFVDSTLTFFWPHSIVVIGQILIGTSIGSRFRKSMFIGLKRIMIVSTLGTLLLIGAMYFCAYIVSSFTGISLITSVLAFAPGGVVEMSTAAVSLHADSTFVVAVQTLRIIMVILLLPSFIKFIHKREVAKKENAGTSIVG